MSDRGGPITPGKNTAPEWRERRIAELEAELAPARAENVTLKAEIVRLKQRIVKLERAGKRQATSFTRDEHNWRRGRQSSCCTTATAPEGRLADPKKPGRQAGQGLFSYRAKPTLHEVDETKAAQLERCPECGGYVRTNWLRSCPTQSGEVRWGKTFKTNKTTKPKMYSWRITKMKRVQNIILIFSVCSLFYLVGSVFVGIGQSSEIFSIQEILEMTHQTNDPKNLEFWVKNLERKTPRTFVEISLLLDALDHPKWEVQMAATLALGNGRVMEATPKLIEKLESLRALFKRSISPADPEFVNVGIFGEVLVAALMYIGNDQAIEPLLEYPEFYTLHMGVKPLAAFGAKALPRILSIARRPNDPRSRAIVGVIGQIKDYEAVPLLLKALRDRDADIRLNALMALRGMRVKQAESEFESLLNDTEANIRISALAALFDLNSDKYFQEALSFLKDVSPYVRGRAVELLGYWEKRDAVVPLEKMLKDPSDIVAYKAAKVLKKLIGKDYLYPRTKVVEQLEKTEVLK